MDLSKGPIAGLIKERDELQTENKQLKEEIIELMIAIIEGSRGYRRDRNEELLIERRKAFGLMKGGK